MAITDMHTYYGEKIAKMIADPAYTGTVTVAPTTSTSTLGIDPMWMEDHKPRKVREFQVHKRVNGPTLLSKPPADLMLKIKADFVKQLVDQLMANDAIEITSVKSDKNASVTFTATLRVETKS